MGMPEMEISEEEEPWILSKPAVITVAMRWCLHKEALGKVSPKSVTCNGLFLRCFFFFFRGLKSRWACGWEIWGWTGTESFRFVSLLLEGLLVSLRTPSLSSVIIICYYYYLRFWRWHCFIYWAEFQLNCTFPPIFLAREHLHLCPQLQREPRWVAWFLFPLSLRCYFTTMVENIAVRNGAPDTEWQFAALSHPVCHLSLFFI